MRKLFENDIRNTTNKIINENNDINNMSDQEKADYVREDWHRMREIQNPSKELQMKVVEDNPLSYRLIKEPDTDVINYMATVKPTEVNERDFHLVTPENQLKAVMKSSNSIYKIKNPTREMVHIAIEKYPSIIFQDLKGYKMDEQDILKALSIDGSLISQLDLESEDSYYRFNLEDYELTDEMLNVAAKQNPRVQEYLRLKQELENFKF